MTDAPYTYREARSWIMDEAWVRLNCLSRELPPDASDFLDAAREAAEALDTGNTGRKARAYMHAAVLALHAAILLEQEILEVLSNKPFKATP